MGRFILYVTMTMVGTGLIYIVSEQFLTFGMKYLMMAPFTGFVACHLMMHVDYKLVVLKLSLIFGGLMLLVSVHMSIAMILAGCLTEIASHFIKGKKTKPLMAGVFFASFAVIFSLVVAKLMVRGVFMNIDWSWIILASMISVILGFVGSLLSLLTSRELHSKKMT